MAIEPVEYCPTCDKVTPSLCEGGPGFDAWYCKVCHTLVDSSLVDDDDTQASGSDDA